MATQTDRMKRMASLVPAPIRHQVLLLVGVLGALVCALAVFIPTVNPPIQDIRLLVLFLSITGTLTVFIAYVLYRMGLMHWFRSLSWTLLVTTVLTVQLVFLNVWITAQLMFISTHDLWLTTALLVFAGVTSITFGAFIAGTITERVQKLRQAIEQLAEGNLEARVTIPGNDELADLAGTFNWMADNLQEIDRQKHLLEETRRSLIAWVSHDLRTPLASMRVMVEAMADGVVTDEATQQRYLANTQAEIQHLSHLIDDLFELAQIDVGQLKLTFHRASLRDLISDTLGTMRAQAEQHEITLKGRVEAGIDPVCMAPSKMQRVLYNLIENAIEHTPPGGTVALQARRSGSQVQVDVFNSGSYIPPDVQPLIFDSFYRGQSDTTRTQGARRGVGLGLAIARAFVEAHGGSIKVTSDASRGTLFRFTFPIAGPPSAQPRLTDLHRQALS